MRSSSLASEVDQRIESLAEMRRDLRIRRAIIAFTQKAIDDWLAASP
jgi:hypothetical protein